MGAPEPTLWSSLPRVGWADADHFSVLSGGAFSDLESIPEPVGVQEVYIMDNFMRALAEFRSPQREGQVTIPIPCNELEHKPASRALIFDARARVSGVFRRATRPLAAGPWST